MIRTEIGGIVNISRRKAIKMIAVSSALLCSGVHGVLAGKPEVSDQINNIISGSQAREVDVFLDVPEIAENGNQVKVAFEIESPMSESDFDAWVINEQKNADNTLSEGSLAYEGQQVYLNAGCTQCHVIGGVWDVQGERIAPNLTHFANRNVFAGAALKNNSENLTKWLANPAELKPGTFMPNLELTEREIEALIEYLGTLK